MPTLLDLLRDSRKVSYNDVVDHNRIPERLRNIPPAPKEPEWDIRSGLPEPGLGHVAPEEWLPTGIGTKLAALAGKGAVLMGAIKSAGKSGLSHNPEERALAFLTAQRNAAKPVSEGGLGLRPNNTAEERAAAMGFKGEGYHYSRAKDEVSELDPLKNPIGYKSMIQDWGASDLDFVGTHVGTKEAARLRFDDTQGPGRRIGGATYPVKFVNDRPMTTLDGNPLWESEMMDNLLRMARPPSEVSSFPVIGLDNVLRDMLPKGEIKAIRKKFASKHSNAPYVNDWEDIGSTSHMVPPQNIRSRFAAFDPAKRGDPDLLGYADPRLLGLIAGGTAGGIALNQLLQLNGTQR